MPIVHYNVPLVGQCNQNACWYACMQMLARWYRREHGLPQGVESAVGSNTDVPEVTSRVRNANERIDLQRPGALRLFAEQSHWNMIERWAANPSIRMVASALQTFGPLIYGGEIIGYRGVHGNAHMVVICGCNPETEEIYINDPWPVPTGTPLTMDRGAFFLQLRYRSGDPLLYAGL